MSQPGRPDPDGIEGSEADFELEPEPTAVTGQQDRHFGRFELCFEIASGGMASVFLARASGPAGFEKLVALKRIHPHLSKQQRFVEMFLDEARIASRISHPNVCSVFDFGEEEGTYFLAMDYLIGEPLSRTLKTLVKASGAARSPALPSIAARIIADACEGLHAAHELRDSTGKLLDVVHRDVSPQNLFVTYSGSTVVVDFGVASAADRVHQTTAGTVKGKYAYMPPEQVRGTAVDRRADIWSLGVVLWELLTLQRLFRRSSEAETIMAVNAAEVDPPSSRRVGVPQELDAIVLKALCADPDGRYATARELGRDLHRFIARQPEPVSVAEVAEWMEGLYPGGREGKRQLVELARQRASIPRIAPSDPSDSALRTGASHVRSAAPPSGRAVQLLAGVGLAAIGALVLGGGAFWLLRGDDESAPAAEAVEVPDMAFGLDESVAPEPEALPPLIEPSVEEPAPAEPARAHDVRRSGTTMERVRSGTGRTRSSMGRTGAAMARPHPSGTVNVVTPGGWAEVWMGGRKIGHAPGRVTLPAGRHTLRIRPNGQLPAKRVRVRVRANRTTRISVPLR